MTTFDFDLATSTLDDGIRLIAVRGEIDLFTAHDVRRAGTEAIDEGAQRVIVDLTDVTFLDSTGLGVLIGLAKRLRPGGGGIAVVNVDDTIATTFSITGLDDMIPVVETREDAVEALRGSGGPAGGPSGHLSGAR